MSYNTFLPFDLPAASHKKVSANFDGGAISSDGGLMLLREAGRRLGLTRRLASCVQDRRDPSRISHGIEEMLLFRIMTIACGREDADDCDELRNDPLFKLAAGRLPERGAPLCSQPSARPPRAGRLAHGPRQALQGRGGGIGGLPGGGSQKCGGRGRAF
jgi:hypothetical protein